MADGGDELAEASDEPDSAEHCERADPAACARVLIVDDHPVVRLGIATVVDGHERLVVVGQAGDGVEAIEAVSRLRPDVVLMDVNMPRMNGIEATREICRRWPATITVGLSMQDDARTADMMMEAGASGFLSKHAEGRRMAETILGLFDSRPRSSVA